MKAKLSHGRGILFALMAALALYARAQDSNDGLSNDAVARYRSDASRAWEARCIEKGCILSIDVLRGTSDDPPDANNVHEYLSIAVALNRIDAKPTFFMFEMPPYADIDQGVFVAFAKTVKDHNQWATKLDSDGASRLLFRSCDEDTCTAVVPGGKVEAGKDASEMNLLDKFLHSDHLMLLYMSKGHPYRTSVDLLPFQKEYDRVLREELGVASKQPK